MRLDGHKKMMVWIFNTWGDLSFLLEINGVKILGSFWNFLILYFIDLLMAYTNQVYSFMVYGTPLQWMFCNFSIIFSYQWKFRMKQWFYFFFNAVKYINLWLEDFRLYYSVFYLRNLWYCEVIKWFLVSSFKR